MIYIIYYRKDPLTGVFSTQTRQTIPRDNPPESNSDSTPKVEVSNKCIAHLLDAKK